MLLILNIEDDNTFDLLKTPKTTYMKKGFLFVFTIILFTDTFSQLKNPKLIASMCIKPDISVSYNYTVPSAQAKINMNAGNGSGIKAAMYVPILVNVPDSASCSCCTKNDHNFGINTELSYVSISTGNILKDVKKSYILSEGNINPNFANKKGNNIFAISVGPKAKFVFNKLIVAPSVQLGFISIKQNGYLVQDRAVVNPGQPTETSLVTFETKNATTSNGFLLKPQLELGYMITDKLSAFVKGSYSMGPTINTSLTKLLPEGGVTTNNTYTYSQLQAGTLNTTITQAKWKALGIGIGINYKF